MTFIRCRYFLILSKKFEVSETVRIKYRQQGVGRLNRAIPARRDTQLNEGNDPMKQSTTKMFDNSNDTDTEADTDATEREGE